MVTYLSLEEVILINENQVELYGGSVGVRDINLLMSAVYRPQASFGGGDLYSSLFEKAAALICGLILNHAFVDGNKRTGLVSMLVFLEINDCVVKAKNKELVQLTLAIATKKMGIEGVVDWLEKHAK